jgi:hypothetical protein
MKTNTIRNTTPGRKISVGLAWAGLALLATTAAASAAMTTLWTENFNSNPVTPAGAWTQSNASGKNAFAWSSANSNLAWQNEYDTSSNFSRAAGVTLTDATGFSYSLKLADSSQYIGWSWYGEMDAGLSKAGGSDSVRVRIVGTDYYPWAGTNYPGAYLFTPQVITSAALTLNGAGLKIGDISHTYSLDVTYQAAIRNLYFTLTDVTTATTIGTSTVTLGAGDHFSLDTFALANVYSGGGNMYMKADDITLAVPEPAALSLLGLGLLALGGRRRR